MVHYNSAMHDLVLLLFRTAKYLILYHYVATSSIVFFEFRTENRKSSKPLLRLFQRHRVKMELEHDFMSLILVIENFDIVNNATETESKKRGSQTNANYCIENVRRKKLVLVVA